MASEPVCDYAGTYINYVHFVQLVSQFYAPRLH